VINGSKMWITNGAQADWICLLANTREGAPHRNKSLICVPMSAKGVTVARKIDKIGMHASDTAEIYFDNVRVPRRYLIGEEGAGFTYQMQQFQEERLWVAASALTTLENAIRQTIDYTRQRKAFGQSILDNQVVHFRLAELQTEIELLRSLTYRAAAMHVAGEDVTTLASMAKLKAGRLLREVPDSCLQYWGGMGYTWENPCRACFATVGWIRSAAAPTRSCWRDRQANGHAPGRRRQEPEIKPGPSSISKVALARGRSAFSEQHGSSSSKSIVSCGSGRRYKHCCGAVAQSTADAENLLSLKAVALRISRRAT
jgi:alkylation response protein AidB-like acyl-CoA dehydrogenase